MVHHRVGGPPWWALVVVVALVAVIVGLAASSFLLGPAVLVAAVVPLAVIALAFEPLFRRWQARHAVAIAEEAGAVEPITIWGKVAEAAGTCPTGATLERGAEFALSQGDIWPHMCQHARTAVLEAAQRMERGECLPDCPVAYHDADHAFRIELHHERKPVHLETEAADGGRWVAPWRRG
jgi:hypothetical protein